jgi:transcriptional regulator with XRE-family HTH domain
MSTTGERIRQAREQAVWGQAELARAAGLSPAGLWQIEHGQRQPRPATIRKIAAALGVSPADLLGDERKSAAPDEAAP